MTRGTPSVDRTTFETVRANLSGSKVWTGTMALELRAATGPENVPLLRKPALK